jgi:hypothetical protein
MANRTFKFYGNGYGSTPANITVAFNGVVIFNGEIPTIDSTTSELKNSMLLFQGGEVPVDFSGTVPMQITVNSGTVMFGEIESNYALHLNPVFTEQQFELLTAQSTPTQTRVDICVPLANPPFTQEEIQFISTENSNHDEVDAVLRAHNVSSFVANGPDVFTSEFYFKDSRTNVTIDGQSVSAPDPRPSDQIGNWYWTVSAGTYFSYDLNITAGEE